MPEPHSFSSQHWHEVKQSYLKQDNKYPDYYYGFMAIVPSYNGKIWGSYAASNQREDYQTQHYNNVMNQIPKLKDVIFDVKDYKELDCTNSLIYCDPPYSNSDNYYKKNKIDYQEFYEWCIKMKEKGNKIFISECYMPDNFIEVWHKEYRRTCNNLKNNKGIKTVEKLFTLP